MADRTRVWMLAVGAPLTLIGLVVLLIGVRHATGTEGPGDDSVTLRGLATIFAGAVIFAVAGLTTLVAIVRPLFEKRTVDHHAEKHR